MGKARRLKRGIYLLPTMFTVGNLFCGFFSLVRTFRGEFEHAALLIIVAAVLDGIDGRIARLTGTVSPFGKEFDSLADLVSFGVAPAMLVYHWALLPLGRIGWLVAFLYVVCAGMRLARFNIRSVQADRRFFTGLPSPSAGGGIASVTFAFPTIVIADWLSGLLAFAVAGLGLLMVGRLRYPSFKQLELRSRHSYLFVLPLAAMLVTVAIHPKFALLLLFLLYLFAAPVLYVWTLARRGYARVGNRAERMADGPALR